MKHYLALFLVLCLLVGCGAEPTPTPDLVATQIAVEKAAHATMTAEAPPPTPSPMDTLPPTDMPEPSNTPGPTDTPEPTPTPIPSSTPEPTSTPIPSSTPEPAQTPLPIGSVVSFADWEYTVTDATTMASVGNATARGVYVIALVQAMNQGATGRELGSGFFVCRDAQGRTYEMDSSASLEYYQAFDTDAWHLEEIGPSAAGTIPVVFDVSPDASGLVLLASGTTEPVTLLIEGVGGEPLLLPGEPSTAVDWAFVITDVSTATSVGDAIARGRYVIVIAVVRNDGSTPRELGSDFFAVSDAQGRTYEMDSSASLEYYQAFDTDAWHLEVLGPSLVGTVPVVFDVSPDATDLCLVTKRGLAEPNCILDAVGGEPVQLTGDVHTIDDQWEFVIREVSTQNSIGNEVPDGQYQAVILEVRNLASSQRQLGNEIFVLKDAQGRTYEIDSSASLEYYQAFDTDAWHLEEIGPSLTGIVPVVFDVATDASGLVLLTQDGTEITLP